MPSKTGQDRLMAGIKRGRAVWRALLRLDEAITIGSYVLPKPVIAALAGLGAGVIALFQSMPLIIAGPIAFGVGLIALMAIGEIPRFFATFKKRSPIGVLPEVYREAAHMLDDKGKQFEGVYTLTFSLRVVNNRADGATLRNVRARVQIFGEPALLIVRGTEASQADIRHGEVVLFEIGRTFSRNGDAMPAVEPVLSTAQGIAEGLAVLEDDQYQFELSLAEPHAVRSIRQLQGFPFKLRVILSADDVVSHSFGIAVDFANNPNQMMLMQPA